MFWKKKKSEESQKGESPQPKNVDGGEPSKPEVSQKPKADSEEKEGFFGRLKKGLSKSSAKLDLGLSEIFTKRKIDEAMLDDLEDLLITADLGVGVAGELRAELARQKIGKEASIEDIKELLSQSITRVLEPVAKPLELGDGLNVILVVGVNGSGKTTTIGKMAAQFKEQGKTVMLAAGDTFRAAAIEQLTIWGERTGSLVISTHQGGDAAALAYDAVKKAQELGVDVLLLDTAGRLQNKTELMEELSKVRRTIAKLDPQAPHHTLLVLDATTGQNAIQQVKIFQDMVQVTGLIMTKLDGTAKGGVVVNLAKNFALPLYRVGVGEGINDLRDFDPVDFAIALMDLQ